MVVDRDPWDNMNYTTLKLYWIDSVTRMIFSDNINVKHLKIWITAIENASSVWSSISLNRLGR